MRPALTLRYPTRVDLDATMDIQIPALAWQPVGANHWQRVYHVGGKPTTVRVTQDRSTLTFFYDTHPESAEQIRSHLTAAFPTTIGELPLDGHPVLKTLRSHYQGVIVMTAPPVEALVLTILSQNRTGEIVRQVYPRLAAACGGATADQLAALPPARLAELIRPAGPYKASRLAETTAIIATIGEPAFERIVCGPGPQALTFLESLPGVAHKTAACVLVFAAASTTTLPVDTHLFRVVDRLGLATHDGRNTKTVRDEIIATLLRHGPAIAPAHFLFLLLGRSTCTAGTPNCADCVLATHCRHATTHPEQTPRRQP